MKTVYKRVFCSRCGDEISAEELAMLSGPTCALCAHMQFEALQIWADKHEMKAHGAMPKAANRLVNLR